MDRDTLDAQLQEIGFSLAEEQPHDSEGFNKPHDSEGFNNEDSMHYWLMRGKREYGVVRLDEEVTIAVVGNYDPSTERKGAETDDLFALAKQYGYTIRMTSVHDAEGTHTVRSLGDDSELRHDPTMGLYRQLLENDMGPERPVEDKVYSRRLDAELQDRMNILQRIFRENDRDMGVPPSRLETTIRSEAPPPKTPQSPATVTPESVYDAINALGGRTKTRDVLGVLGLDDTSKNRVRVLQAVKNLRDRGDLMTFGERCTYGFRLLPQRIANQG